MPSAGLPHVRLTGWITRLTPFSQEELNEVAAELNGHPRKTLQFKTPAKKFAEAVATTP